MNHLTLALDSNKHKLIDAWIKEEHDNSICNCNEQQYKKLIAMIND